jgi:hypothetical protein
MAEMINREAPLSGLSSLMAMKGRQGDTELIHMTKPEIAGLASLGKITINPDTGLPEAFSFKQILPALVGAGISFASGGTLTPMMAALASGAGAGATSAVVNKGDVGAIAFDALLAGAGGALSAGLQGAGTAADAAKTIGAVGETGKLGAYTAASEGTQQAIKGGVQEGLGQSLKAGALTPELISKASPELVTNAAKQQSLMGKGLSLFMDPATTTKPILGGLTTPVELGSGLASSAITSGGTAALGMPTTGGGMLESMKVDTPEIASRKAAESSYGTRAADEIRQPAKVDGLTTQEVLSSALGRSDPLTYLSGSRPSNVSSPSNLYGGPTGVVGMPAKGMGPVGGYVPQAASGGSLQDLYEGMGGDIQTFKGLVEGGEIGADGMSDDVEFDVVNGGEEGPDKALLSKDEYVIDAHSVAALGNGSTDAGADRLDKFVANLRNKAYNKGKQPKQLNGLKELATLMS